MNTVYIINPTKFSHNSLAHTKYTYCSLRLMQSQVHAQAHTEVSLRVEFITCEIIVFSCKEKIFIEGFSIEHNQL